MGQPLYEQILNPPAKGNPNFGTEFQRIQAKDLHPFIQTHFDDKADFRQTPLSGQKPSDREEKPADADGPWKAESIRRENFSSLRAKNKDRSWNLNRFNRR
jgi:hypothetical protein